MSQRAHNKGKNFKKEPKEFDEQVIEIARVTKVVKGGRRLRFRATITIGNRKGKVGIGMGKSHEVTGAIQKAISRAKKDMATIVLNDTTIPHEIRIKLKSSDLQLIPAAPGTGLKAGSTIRKVLELAGVKDILSKSYGTTNKVNNTKAVFEALKMLKETPQMKKAKANAKAKPENKNEEVTGEPQEGAEAKPVKAKPVKAKSEEAQPEEVTK